MQEISDKEILQLFRKEEKKEYAFELLVKKFQKPLYWHIRRMVIVHDDADDILQNTFIKVWKRLSAFRGDSELYTWLYRIATNESITFLNKKRKRFQVPIMDVNEQFLEIIDSSSNLSGNEIQQKLQKAILTLPDKQRLVFNMKYFDDMKYEEMSKMLKTSVGALKASYHLAVKKIEEYIKSD